LSELTVVAGPSSPELAAKVAAYLDASLVQAELRIFSDGESKIRLAGPVSDRCIIVQSTHPPTDSHLLQTMMIARKCADAGTKVCAAIPYLAYARQDRAFLDGEVVSIALVARLLESSGVSSVVTVDIHSQAALAHFARIKNISSIPLLARHAAGMNLSKPIAVSPDAGGAARVQEFARILNTDSIALKKTRDRNSGEVTIDANIDADISGRDAILVDDMISSGGSIVKAAEVLKTAGAGRVYAMCAHALLIGDAADRIKSSGVQEIIATNSVPSSHSKVDLSAVLADAARGIL
jgi:ribose-phosphate pyrophosphokinase